MHKYALHGVVGLAFVCWAPWLHATTPCFVPGWHHELQCGQLSQPLDAASPQGVQIEVHYVVAPAMARHKNADPVFFLAGGPGQSAIAVLPQMLGWLSRLNQRRDVVFVDQRGTGLSAPLQCARSSALLGLEQQLVLLERCRLELAGLPYVGGVQGLRFFATSTAVQDLDAVRRELGAKRINLVGGSYGTRVALEYQRQFAVHVRRMVLDGVAPPDMVLPASMSLDSQAVLDAVFAACTQDVHCHKAHPNLKDQWVGLLRDLPKSVVLANAQPVLLTRELLLGSVRGALYAPLWVSALPVAIRSANQGRWQALLNLGSDVGAHKVSRPAMGMHFAVVCSEDVPRLERTSEPAGADFSDASALLYRRACSTWPRAQVPPAFYTLPAGTGAALVLSGGLDPVTPPRHGQRVVDALGAAAKHVVVKNAGHGVMQLGCMADVVFQFVNAPDDTQALQVDAACSQEIPRPLVFEPVSP
jgi:pimeloyl-ACP methyl ester carboxylesterase